MKKREEDAFEGVIDIDKTRLDDECENQPRKVWSYGKMYAKAVRDMGAAKAALKVAEADADSAIREDPGDYGLTKITEVGVKNAIIRCKEYKEAQQTFLEAEYRVNMLDAANRTLDHRRTSLTMLNSQDERDYFSRPQQKQRSDTGKNIHRKPLKKRRP